MINEITIKRFKAISEIMLPLDRTNLLIGSNNSGKSSVLQAVQFAVSVAQTMKEQGGEWRLGKMELAFPPDRLVYSPLRDIASLCYNRFFSEGRAGIEMTFRGTPQTQATGAQPPTLVETSIGVKKGRGQNIKCTMIGRDLGGLFTPMNQPFSQPSHRI